MNVFPALCSDRELAARNARSTTPIVARSFAAGMSSILVIENGEVLAWVEQRILDEAKIDAARAGEMAMANLRRRTPTPLRLTRLHPDHAVFAVGDDDGLGSGRLFLHDLFAPMAEGLGEAVLLARVITRGMVVCCVNTPGDMGFVDTLCAQAANAPGHVGGDWLAWTADSWATIEIG